MKKYFLLFAVLWHTAATIAQSYDVSGTWNGTIHDPNAGTTEPFTLKIRLIDSCNVRYRADQYQMRTEFGLDHISYDLIQAGNFLIRDAMSYYHDYNKSIHFSLAHMKAVLDTNNHLSGIRNAFDPQEKPENFLLHRTETFNYHMIPSCNPIESICQSDNKFHFTDTVEVPTGAMVSLLVNDDVVSDSDLVTIFVGGKKILESIPLYQHAPYLIPVQITHNMAITWCACNQGRYGKNTGTITMEIYRNNQKIQKVIPVYLKTDERVSVFIKTTDEQLSQDP